VPHPVVPASESEDGNLSVDDSCGVGHGPGSLASMPYIF
jgi:hypothetical protein